MAEALYRKYRPQVFEDVIGQEHIERTLTNAIMQDKVSHAYLFCGPRGTGKTTTARLLAKALLCEQGPTPQPDGTCPQCLAIASGTHPDVYELDAASRTGVENVREEIIGRVQFAPIMGRYKVYIIDEVHMLSTAAFNALLKTLEEPPSHVVFILCTTDPQKVPETIHSRCQRFDFHRISVEAIVTRLGAICVAEGVEFEGDALDLIAYRAEGGMRDALTSLEQLIAFGEGKVSLESAERLLGSLDVNDMAEIVGAIGRRDIATCFAWTANYVETGADLAQFVRDLAQHMRNMYVLSLSDSDTVLEVSEVVRRELALEMQYFGVDRLTRMLAVLGGLSAEMRTSSNPRLSFEIALTRMVRPDSDLTLESLAERVEALEAQLAQGAPRGTGRFVTLEGGEPSNVTKRPVPLGAPGPAGGAPIPQGRHARRGICPRQGRTPDRTPAPEQGGAPGGAPVPEQDNLENPAALQRIWQAALKIIKKDKTAYGVLFLNVRTSYDRANHEVVIAFPAENMFAYSAVQKPEVLAIVSQALQEVAGSPVPFRLVQAPQPDPGPQGVPTAQQPVAQGTPVQAPAAPAVAPPTAPPAAGHTGDSAPGSPGADGSIAAAASGPATPDDGKGGGSAAPDDSGDAEKDVHSILAETYGDEIVFEMVQEEERGQG